MSTQLGIKPGAYFDNGTITGLLHSSMSLADDAEVLCTSKNVVREALLFLWRNYRAHEGRGRGG